MAQAFPADNSTDADRQYKLRKRFQQLATEYEEKSRYMSNTAQMARLEPYQSIIAMGPAVVPLILEEIQRGLGFWFDALEAITGENPVPPELEGRVRLMEQAWLNWGKQRGFLGA